MWRFWLWVFRGVVGVVFGYGCGLVAGRVFQRLPLDAYVFLVRAVAESNRLVGDDAGMERVVGEVKAGGRYGEKGEV